MSEKSFAIGLALWLPALAALGGEHAVSPYVDPAQLDCPWPKMSHYKQPWRGYLETRSGCDFLNGVGVNLHISTEKEELAIRLLAETGLKTFRVEIGRGEMTWDEAALNNEAGMRCRLAWCSQNSIRPTILLNAHHGVPCPVRFFERRLSQDVPKGSRAIRLDSVKDLVIGRSGLKREWSGSPVGCAIPRSRLRLAPQRPPSSCRLRS